MVLKNEEIKKLLAMVGSVTPDELDCDDCYTRIAEFADTELAGKTHSDALRAVQDHLHNCPCCRAEYEMLLAALQASE